MDARKLDNLLLAICHGIARNTKSPVIKWDGSSITLQVCRSDQGRMVGKSGANFWAAATAIFHASPESAPVRLRLLEPIDGKNGHAMPFKANPDWNRPIIHHLLDELTQKCCSTMGSWMIEERGAASARVTVSLPEKDKQRVLDPNLSEAIKILVHAAGMAGGVSLDVDVAWA